MIDHIHFRTVQLHIDILASSDAANSVVSEDMRTQIMQNSQDLIADLFSRCIIDKPTFHDLLNQVSAAYVGGAQ